MPTETVNVKVQMPKSLRTKLGKLKMLEGVTVSEQVRRALIEHYGLDDEEHPPVSNYRVSGSKKYEDWRKRFEEENRIPEERACKRGCGFSTDWQPSLTSHERHHCPKRPSREYKSKEQRRAEKESTEQCSECGAYFHTYANGDLYRHKNRDTGEHPCSGGRTGPHPDSAETKTTDH